MALERVNLSTLPTNLQQAFGLAHPPFLDGLLLNVNGNIMLLCNLLQLCDLASSVIEVDAWHFGDELLSQLFFCFLSCLLSRLLSILLLLFMFLCIQPKGTIVSFLKGTLNDCVSPILSLALKGPRQPAVILVSLIGSCLPAKLLFITFTFNPP